MRSGGGVGRQEGGEEGLALGEVEIENVGRPVLIAIGYVSKLLAMRAGLLLN